MKKSSFIYNLVLTLGIVIGVGIFFKNMTVISAAHGNTTYVILGWVIGGLISLASAFAFADLAFKTKNTNNNLSEFYRMAFGEKFGKFSKLSFAFVYYPIYSFVISIFSTKYILELFNVNVNQNTWMLILIALLITMVFIISVNYSEKFATASQTITTIIKLIPFLVLAIIAISAIFGSNSDAYWNKSYPASHYTKTAAYNQTSHMSGISVIFWIVPSTKLAFDGFASVTANKTNTTPKKLKAGILVGMLIIVAVYLLSAVAVLKEGTLGVPEAMVKFFGGNPAHMTSGYRVLDKFIKVVIIISGLGALNGFTIVWKRSINQILRDRKMTCDFKKTSFLMIIGLLVSTLPWTIMSIAMSGNNVGLDIIDEVSDIVLLVSFTINAIVFVKFLIMAFKKTIEIPKITMIALMIAILGTGTVAGFKLIDDLIIQMVEHWDAPLFGTIRLVYFGLFFGVIATFVMAPFLVDKLLKSKAFDLKVLNKDFTRNIRLKKKQKKDKYKEW